MTANLDNQPVTYWAATEDPEEFGQSYFDRAASGIVAGTVNATVGLLQLLSHEHYYNALPTGFAGSLPSSAQINRAGEQGENVELTVNWLRSHINAKHQIVVAPTLAWEAQPTNTDSRSLADAARGSSILEYLWKSGTYAEQAVSAVLGSILYGEEFLFTYWSPTAGDQVAYDQETQRVSYTGDLKCFNVSSWDVSRDPSAKTYEQSDWLSAHLAVNRWDLIAQFPDHKELILKAAAPLMAGIMGAGINGTTASDKVTAHYFFHKRTPACPKGVQAVLLNEDCVLEFQPLEKCYWKLPIHRVCAGELKGTPYAYSDVWECMAIQDLATDVQGSLATNIVSFGKQLISAESDQDLPVSQIGNGPLVLYRPKGSPPPVALQLTQSPPEAFKHLERLRADQRMILGLNDVAMGDAATQAPNAQAWALLSAAAITANSGLQRSYVKMVESVGRSMLAIFREKASYPRKVAIVGVHGPQLAHNEEYDCSTFEGIEDITVTAANPLSQTAAGRLQLVELFKPFALTIEQTQSVAETGKLEPLTQGLRDELILIASENESILKGETPAVLITDSHQMHCREHKAATYAIDSRQDPKVTDAANAHIKAHLDVLLNPANAQILKIFGQAIPEQTAAPAGPVAPQAGDPKPAIGMDQPVNPAATAANGIKLPTAPKSPMTGAPENNNGIKQ